MDSFEHDDHFDKVYGCYEPDDLEEYNRNEADYLHEDDGDDDYCELCGGPCTADYDPLDSENDDDRWEYGF